MFYFPCISYTSPLDTLLTFRTHCGPRVLISAVALWPLTCRVAAGCQEPLALRQLLWLDDDLFVGVTPSLLPSSSTVLVLRPAGDADGTLAVR